MDGGKDIPTRNRRVSPSNTIWGHPEARPC
jgi:hypothetical protein